MSLPLRPWQNSPKPSARFPSCLHWEPDRSAQVITELQSAHEGFQPKLWLPGTQLLLTLFGFRGLNLSLAAQAQRGRGAAPAARGASVSAAPTTLNGHRAKQLPKNLQIQAHGENEGERSHQLPLNTPLHLQKPTGWPESAQSSLCTAQGTGG